MQTLRARWIRNSWSGHQFPHPGKRRPFIGDLGVSDPRNPILSVLALGTQFGGIYELKVFRQKFVFVASAELTAELCDETRFCKTLPPAIAALRDYGGDGLFTAYTTEPNWQLAHDLLMPAFTKPAMRSYHRIMLDTAAELFAYWDAIPGGRVDVTRDMTKLTMETLSRAAFSRDFGSFTTPRPHPFVQSMITALRTSRRKGALRTAPGGRLYGRYLAHRAAPVTDYAYEMVDEMIADRVDGPHRDDLLGIMLKVRHPETGERLSRLNMRYQILTFLVAGHETTSGALSFTLYFLSQNPECLRLAQREADEILGTDPDAEPTFEQVSKFRYIRRCLDESLRLWPTVPAFSRRPVADTVLAGKYPMRSQDWALIMLGQVHRDPAVWENPETFDPDRFLPEEIRKRPAHSYKPFGTGMRACIGRQFALHESVLVLARLVHRYDITPDADYRLDVTERLTMVPKNFHINLTPRRATPASRACGSAPGHAR